jgi:hypothetical protein
MSDEKEGDPGYEGSPGEEGEIVGSNLSTKRQKTMLELLELHDKRVKSPDLDPTLEKSIHKLDDFAPSPTRYARRQRLQLVIKRAGKPEVKKALSGYVLVEHRDQFDAHDGKRRVLVESDKTSFVIIGHYIDQKNVIGRNMRKSGIDPITTLADTLSDLLGAEVLITDPDKPPEEP